MPDDRSDSDAGTPGSGRKTKPPVIELTATDVTPESSADQPAKEDATAQHEVPPSSSSAKTAPGSSRGSDPLILAILAGVIGLLTGALVLALIFLFAGDSARRLMASAAETASSSRISSDLAAVQEHAAQLAKKQDGIEKRAADLEAQAKKFDLAPVQSRLDKLAADMAELRRFAERMQTERAASDEALGERIDAFDAKLKQATARPALADAAEVVALGALRDAIAKGTPFAKELGAVRAMLGDAGASLAPLESSAAKGLPTMADLRRSFAQLAPKLAHEPKSESGYLARLMSSASRLVEIRPVGEVAGTSAGAVVARIETRLANNDLAAALNEAGQLPPSAKAQAADWIAAASRRREADTAVRNLLDAALARPAGAAK